MSQINLQDAIAALQEQVRVLQESQKSQQDSQREHGRKLPVELSRKVKAVYSTLTEKFDFKQTFRAPENTIVTELLMTAIVDETEYESKLIRRAVQRFFEGRKRIDRNSTDKQQQWNDRKKLRSRRERLYNMRKKFARGEEIEVISRAHPDTMSDEDSDEDTLVMRAPKWRKKSFGDMLHEIDSRIVAEREKNGVTFYCSRKRRRGCESERERSVMVREEFVESDGDVSDLRVDMAEIRANEDNETERSEGESDESIRLHNRNIDVRTISKLKRRQLKDIRSVMYRKRNNKM